MKKMKVYLRKLSLLLIAALMYQALDGQSGFSTSSGLDEFSEKLVMSTDRDLYFTGEQVMMKIYKINRNSGLPSGLSRIIYAEMLDRSNNPVAQLKIFADGTTGNGRFTVPDTLSSGNYIIRAYTRWMLNFSENLFSYKIISVINPFKKFTGPAANNIPSSLPGHKFKNKNDEDIILEKVNGLTVISDRPEYLCRNRVSVDISSLDPAFDLRETNFSVSVVKSILAGSGKINLREDLSGENIKPSFTRDTLQLPELEGEIISGTMRDRVTNEPLSNTKISLSIVGKYSRCRFGTTNINGEFMFTVDRLYGMNDMVIQPMTLNRNGYYVELNQPFTSSFIDFPVPEFYLDSTMAGLINNAIISMQVNKSYASLVKNQEVSRTPEKKTEFYDTPDRRVYLSDYIELTNIREVVREILPEVSVTGRDENARFKVTYRNPFGKFENPALVLVDGVPVRNIGKLLDIPSKFMEKIDMINVRYFYADFVFDGIISFVTKKGNLSDLGYDDSVFRQVFEGCSEAQEFYSPSYDTDSLRKSHLPDFRNTLFWDPDINTGNGGKTNIEFYTSDEPGEYMIIVEGITSNGKPVSGRSSFLVK
jgi:hypothetical protein